MTVPNGDSSKSAHAPEQPEGTDLRREKDRVLLTAWLLSLWAPLASGAAAFVGKSAVQTADFLRRTSELVALILAWAVNRKTSRAEAGSAGFPGSVRAGDPSGSSRASLRLASLSSLLTACVMILSFAFIVHGAARRFIEPSPVANVVPGVLVALGGGAVNGYFWRKSRRLCALEPSPIFETQWRLYRAKTVMDSSVVIALCIAKAFQSQPWSRYADPGGSAVVAVFLLVSALRIGTRAVRELRSPPHPPEE